MKIIVLGDSFTFGQGCSDVHQESNKQWLVPSEFGWPSLLGKKHSTFNIVNLAYPGLDNISIVERLWKNLTNDIDMVVFCASLDVRYQVKHPLSDNVGLSIMPNFNKSMFDNEFNQCVTDFYKYLHNDLVGFNYTTSAVLSAYACAQLVGAEFLWSMPRFRKKWFRPKLEPLPESSILRRLDNFQFESNHFFPLHQSERAPCGHPNDRGQLRYFRSIIEPMFDKYV